MLSRVAPVGYPLNTMNTRSWIRAAGMRAVKTGAQTAVALLGTGGIGLVDVNWLNLASVVGMAVLASFLNSVAGLPESPKK